MKKIFVACFLFFILPSFGFKILAQNDVRNSVIYKLNIGVYNRSIKYNDYRLAINALYNLCVLEPQNDSLLVALEYIYFNNREYISAVLVANDALMLNPNNIESREMKAISLEQIGAKDKAIEEYETLYLKNNQHLDYLYKTAFLQYDVQRYKEAKTNVDILLSMNVIDSLEITFPKGENEQQQIPMRASLFNLKGMIEQALGNKEEAKKQFGAALEIIPDFYLARQNLDLLVQPAK